MTRYGAGSRRAATLPPPRAAAAAAGGASWEDDGEKYRLYHQQLAGQDWPSREVGTLKV